MGNDRRQYRLAASELRAPGIGLWQRRRLEPVSAWIPMCRSAETTSFEHGFRVDFGVSGTPCTIRRPKAERAATATTTGIAR
ncbi:hypothetical protein D3C75_1012300 [compost metagenome]